MPINKIDPESNKVAVAPDQGKRKIYIFNRTRNLSLFAFLVQMVMLCTLAGLGLESGVKLEADTVRAFIGGYGFFCVVTQIALHIPAIIAVSGNAVEHLGKGLAGYIGSGKE